MTQQCDSFHTLTVLIADAHPASRKILRTMLLHFGVKAILEAATPDDAARSFREHPVDIVFLDLDFGGAEQGFQFLRQIRDRERSRDPFVPVVIMGHQVAPQAVTAARDYGAHEFLGHLYLILPMR